jgi:hypothetical protein
LHTWQTTDIINIKQQRKCGPVLFAVMATGNDDVCCSTSWLALLCSTVASQSILSPCLSLSPFARLHTHHQWHNYY